MSAGSKRTDRIGIIEQESRRESLRIEKFANIFRIVAAVVGAIIVTIVGDSIPTQSVNAVYVAGVVLVIHSLALAILLWRAHTLARTYLLVVQHISSIIDVLTVSVALWAFGGYVTFKSHVFQVYFLFIALAAFRYSRSLTIFTAVSTAIVYIGMFVFAVLTGRVTLGSLSEEYIGPVVSATGIIIKSSFLILISMVMSSTARGYRNVTNRVVKSEEKSIQRHEQAQSMRAVLTRYFTEEVADYIVKNEHDLVSERREVTVMFCDFRGFTEMSNILPTEKTVLILNKYLSAMVEVVFSHNGTLDKYMGDGFMAVFGVPISKGDDAYNALSAASDIVKCVEELNTTHADTIPHALNIGIGISSGEVIAGNVGSKKRLEYTVIGEAVNLASRLEKLNKQLKSRILLSKKTQQLIDGRIDTKACGAFKIRGIAKPVHVFKLS